MSRLALLIHLLVLSAILLAGFAPLLGVMAVGLIAEANGCRVDEGSPHPCVVNGVDIGQSLYSVGVLGWLMLATIPLGLGAAGLYLAAIGAYYLVRRLRRNRNPGAKAPG